MTSAPHRPIARDGRATRPYGEAPRAGRFVDAALAPFVFLWRNGPSILRLTAHDLAKPMSGAALGSVWVFLQPAILFLTYIVLFAVLLHVRIEGLGDVQYVAYIIAGLAPAIAFTQAITLGTTALVGNAHLLKGTLVDPRILPVKAALNSQPTQAVGVAIALLLGLAYGFLTLKALLVIVYCALFVLLLAGIGWALAIASVFVRDLIQIVPTLLTPFMLLSPIAYPLDQAPVYVLPFIYINPYTYIVVIPQRLLVVGAMPPWSITLLFCISSLICYIGGYIIFRRAITAVYDHV
jgi:lipopolysaccharide transport system permease protein